MTEERRLASCACGRRWGGLSQAHCARCHAHFSTVSNFDAHRRDGYCRPPMTARRDNGQPIFTARQGPHGTTYIGYMDPDTPNWRTAKDEEER